MSNNFINDIEEMHIKYKVEAAVRNMDLIQLKKYLDFRIEFLQEELTELRDAKSADDVVDALIDLTVVALGTLEAFKINTREAWDEVLNANMKKEVGIKLSRPNPLGLPDLIKPVGWVSPSHSNNIGYLGILFNE